MATTTLLPDADTTTNWTTFGAGTAHWDRIDEDISVTYDDTNGVETTTLTADDQWTFGDTPANTASVSQVYFSFRVGINDPTDAAYVQLTLYKAGPTQVGSTQNITTTDIGFNDGTIATVNKTFSGAGFPLTKAEADGLQLKVVFNNV